MSKDEPELAWTIDVCATCGRLAAWPGCEHWQSAPAWCMAIQVRPTAMSAKRLRAAMRDHESPLRQVEGGSRDVTPTDERGSWSRPG